MIKQRKPNDLDSAGGDRVRPRMRVMSPVRRALTKVMALALVVGTVSAVLPEIVSPSPASAATLAVAWNSTLTCGTYDYSIVPQGTTSITITVYGGGAGGGATAGASSGGGTAGSGGPGGSTTVTYAVTPGDDIGVEIGCGGAGGVHGSATGSVAGGAGGAGYFTGGTGGAGSGSAADPGGSGGGGGGAGRRRLLLLQQRRPQGGRRRRRRCQLVLLECHLAEHRRGQHDRVGLVRGHGHEHRRRRYRMDHHELPGLW
jgi:hypothetical protein